MFVMTLFYICLSMIKTELDMMDDDSTAFSSNLSLVISICTFSLSNIFALYLVIILFLRYVCLNELEIDQKKFYYVRREHGLSA